MSKTGVLTTMKEKPIFGFHTRKVQPRLRMCSNGSTKVNAIRAKTSSSIKVSDSLVKEEKEKLARYGSKAKKKDQKPKKGSLRTPPGNIESSVFVHFTNAERPQTLSKHVCGKSGGAEVSATRANMTTVSLPLDEIIRLVDDPMVSYIEQGESLKLPTPIVNGTTARPRKQQRKFDTTGGAKTLIGIIDVGGFDFAHEDFLDRNGHTRFERIWDQGGDSRPQPKRTSSSNAQDLFNYGAEIKKAHMNAAIDGASSTGLPAHRLEPQSQMSPGSHATHVASIAAGNHGVCRSARIVGVLIDIPAEHNERRRSFYDSTQIAHAIDYIKHVGDEIKAEEGLDELPISINISLGTNGNAHDGSSALARWVDSALTEPGISVSVAAGNSGQERATSPDDFGYVSGRIHSSGQIVAQGLVADLEWQVVGNTVADVSENEMEIWYSPADRFSVSVKPPGHDWLDIVHPGNFMENVQLDDGSMISVYNELYHPINGANYIALYLSPFISDTQIVGVRAGVWKVRIHGTEVRDGHYHAWIERDDPFQFNPVGPITPWRFPSFFSETSNVDNSSVSSLACAQNVIAVANFDDADNKINISSSQGPTRDGRNKPEVAAPGTRIVAANGFQLEAGERWVAMTGTSMASPYVAGVAGLMLHHNPSLTASQIRGILQRTTKTLPGSDYAWKNDAGYGVLDPAGCIDEVDVVYRRKDIE